MKILSASRLPRLGLLSVLFLSLVIPARAYAHCDTMDGPVVEAAQRSLQSGEVEHVLPWILEQDEEEVRHAFEHAVQVRALGGEAAELAERYFFETVVRIHREGEGESYTGLKPAGTNMSTAVPAADLAIKTGSVIELEAMLLEPLSHMLHERLARVVALRDFERTNVAEGRDFVAAYVELLHFVEHLEAALVGSHTGAAGHPGIEDTHAEHRAEH